MPAFSFYRFALQLNWKYYIMCICNKVIAKYIESCSELLGYIDYYYFQETEKMSDSVRKRNGEYGNDSLSALKGAERVRKRPAVIFGSDGIDGCQHAVFEILSNSIDEAREGYGKLITLTKFEDGAIEIEDFGRGCPVDWNEKEQMYNWELAFCELYAGAKYRNNESFDYEYSLGLNGLGLCATQYTSESMNVTIYRDGKKYSLRFEKGEITGEKGKELKHEPHDGKRTGTIIRWKPDLEVFTDISLNVDYFHDMMKRQAVINGGITFRFKNQVGGRFETTDFLYQEGLMDYIEEIAGGKMLTQPVFIEAERKGRDRPDMADYKVKLSAAFCFSNSINVAEYYHNSSWLEHGGSPEKATRSAFVAEIDAYLRKTNKYKGNESKVTFADVQDCLVLITNCFSTVASFENQTKKAITNKFIQEAMTEFLRSNLEVYFIENKAEAEKIAEQVLINKRSRETAERTRQSIKKKLSGGVDIGNRVQKFVDCRTKDVSKREIYIVEGDSALGACKLSRDAEFQGIIPVRGKILNCLKADYSKIFANEIITDIIRVLGCGVEIKNKHTKDLSGFDLDNLRWNRINICTDADVDGFQIRGLILTMLYRLVPTLIEEGYVYIAESPLFEIESKGKTYFAYSDRERNEIIESLNGAKHTISRSKGLGENDPEMMWLTTMNPETRRLIKVMPEDAEKMAEKFELFFGNNLAGRKDFISEFGHKYLDFAYVS